MPWKAQKPELVCCEDYQTTRVAAGIARTYVSKHKQSDVLEFSTLLLPFPACWGGTWEPLCKWDERQAGRDRACQAFCFPWTPFQGAVKVPSYLLHAQAWISLTSSCCSQVTFSRQASEVDWAGILCAVWTYLCVVGWPWLDARCPPKPLYHSPSSAGQGRKK